MFTGIIEEIGRIKNIKRGAKSASITIEASKVLEDTKIGDSICTNGVCLTVTNMTNYSFDADMMEETLKRTNFSEMTIGSEVNLERALTLSTRLGGHIVSGHIDGVGKLMAKTKVENATVLQIETSKDILKYIIEKGSIAIDGISLTVVEATHQYFSVSIIPQTKDETTLLGKKIGSTVNLEADMIGKYVERLLFMKEEQEQPSKINEEFLKMNGFM